MADRPQGDPPPVERLNDHLDEVDERSEEMQERLDELGENIDAARRQAEADNLLPDEEGPEGGDAAADGPPIAPRAVPRGDPDLETPVDDAEFESGA